MRILLKLILRNILKYKRKTIIVFISILLSVIIVVFSQGFIEGFNNMLLELIFNNLGHVTIRHSEFEKGEVFLSLDYLVHHYSSLINRIKQDNEDLIREINGELTFGGILYSEKTNCEMMGKGVEIEKPGSAVNFRKSIKKGNFPQKNGQICISTDMADLLKTEIGEKLMVLSSNVFSGFDVIELEIIGLFKTEVKEENENIFLISLDDASSLLKVDDAVSIMDIKLYDYKKSDELVSRLHKNILTSDEFKELHLDALTWEEIRPELTEWISVVGFFVNVIFIIIVIVVGSGIINSIFMSVFERFRDFGTMRAIGLKKRGLLLLITLENCCIGFIASLIGMILGSVLIFLIAAKGINFGVSAEQIKGLSRVLYPVFTVKIGFMSLIIGVIISFFGSIIPALSAYKLKIVDIMRHN